MGLVGLGWLVGDASLILLNLNMDDNVCAPSPMLLAATPVYAATRKQTR